MSPALFLDRDGIIIRDSGYAKDSSQVKLLPGMVQLMHRARARGWKIVVVTNQSGLGRGWVRVPEYQAVSHRMLELLQAEGETVDAVYFAPFYEPENPGKPELQIVDFEHQGVREQGRWDPMWRKPLPGMLWQAARDLCLDVTCSVMIGDRATDQVAGALAGVARTYFFKSEIYETEFPEINVWKKRLPELRRIARDWRATHADLMLLSGTGDLRELNPHPIESFHEVELI